MDHDVAEALSYFEYKHLPPHLQEMSIPFHDLAHSMASIKVNHKTQLMIGLQKLLESKDCLVRSMTD